LPGRFAAQPRLAYASRSWLRCERLPAKKRFLRWTNACSQERRASARRGLANALAGRFDLRSANKRTRSGGRQPAVGWQTRLQDDSICVRRTTAPGAAGVSPPWYRKTHLQRGAIFAELITFATHHGPVYHGGLTPPALVLRCECLPAKKRFLRWTNACFQERRASARRGSGNALAGRFDFRSANNRTRSGGRQPAVGDNVTATAIRHTFGHGHHTRPGTMVASSPCAAKHRNHDSALTWTWRYRGRGRGGKRRNHDSALTGSSMPQGQGEPPR
jgi:hypothetical protein